MYFYELLLLQLIAHLLGDFVFQSEKNANDKNSKGLKSRWLPWHTLIIFITSWALSWSFAFFLPAIFISLTHWIIDANKHYLSKIDFLARWQFFIDQFVHLIIISGVVFLFSYCSPIKPFFNLYLLTIIFTYIFIFKPANILIGEIFKFYKIPIPEKEGLENAGKLIGDCERVLILTLILCNHIEVVGFVLAAKSILRYKESNAVESTNTSSSAVKTEYILTGTLLSFGIAILLGLAIQYFKNHWF